MNELLPLEQALARAQNMDAFTAVGLSLPDYLEPVDYYCLGVTIEVTDTGIGWARADLALRIKTDFPTNYRELWRQFLPRYDFSSLDNDARTASRYTPQERYQWTIEDGLSYSHCAKASHLEPVDYREDVLRQARDLGWSVRDLENYIATGHTNRGALPAPSRDVRKRVGEWLESLPNDETREYARSFVIQYLDWLESQ